ncbi:hypothetical protein TBLA_0B07280 [Henningerozyma blattae CBS 6284]|uniref:Cell wall mannoprotein PIR1-like C-terminal domain-containing protein n=1 Tax=Henningerozyma blattae (strain ATCC 34711 / CBS 6284 / DSM 70876 / NBRC 10599 / NRRL Y-10934 / UCD 77-7) TaxID=1071380 RepID=I2GZJ4_HENB6|nr:hypothetical protein TBLA_0B07280 [Tetrapisispora blattae CBS 6284]CCH59546.1 hypothetical protein TBLA_0B07280 [Tetrapisispora blattae CBS 6284]
MQIKKTLTVSALVGTSMAAVAPSQPWTTLTPSGTYSGGVKNYSSSFGISVVPIATSLGVNQKNVVTQISDGQVQATTKASSKPVMTTAVVSQISDGQIQVTGKPSAAVVSQISDGQPQNGDKTITFTKKSTTVIAVTMTGNPVTKTVNVVTTQPVSQVGDGQVQTGGAKATAGALSQIGDGQVQDCGAKATAGAVSQIGDGQVQAAAKTTASPVFQISDGQIRATQPAVSQISDGQVQATKTGTSKPTTTNAAQKAAATESTSPNDPVRAVACNSPGTLDIALKNGVLTDSKGRIGSIVSNRQFQFDGPPPQSGAIYAAGWSITPQGNLALGSQDVFYQCLSGTFYNLYDESIGKQCQPVYLQAIDLVNC